MLGEVLGKNVRAVRAHHQHARQGQGDRGSLARLHAPADLVAQSRQFVEDEVVDALIQAVRAAYPGLAHRYYRMKARWLGRGAAANTGIATRRCPTRTIGCIPWSEAKQTVLEAYGAFSPELASVGARFFANPWIDAPTRPGKAPGAFAHPTVPSAHPYLLLNYQGEQRDVMTLAHELGHGVHQVLAGKQGCADVRHAADPRRDRLGVRRDADLPRPAAAQSDPKRRKIMLAGKVEDMLNTVVRQIAF